MLNCKFLLVTEAERNISMDVREFKNMETPAFIRFFFLQGKALKEIHAILTET